MKHLNGGRPTFFLALLTRLEQLELSLVRSIRCQVKSKQKYARDRYLQTDTNRDKACLSLPDVRDVKVCKHFFYPSYAQIKLKLCTQVHGVTR